MPTRDHLVQVARSIRRDLDRDRKAFASFDRMELTRRLRDVSGEGTTRIKTLTGGALERALIDQGLRCQPGLQSTTTGDRVRIFRAGSAVGDLIDAVLLPSPESDRELAEALANIDEGSDGSTTETQSPGSSAAQVIRRILPREKQLDYVRAIEDPDLATT